MTEQKKCCCQNTDIAKQAPRECSPDQIKECHGDAEQHACETATDGDR
jgi:hypothetical protein